MHIILHKFHVLTPTKVHWLHCGLPTLRARSVSGRCRHKSKGSDEQSLCLLFTHADDQLHVCSGVCWGTTSSSPGSHSLRSLAKAHMLLTIADNQIGICIVAADAGPCATLPLTDADNKLYV